MDVDSLLIPVLSDSLIVTSIALGTSTHREHAHTMGHDSWLVEYLLNKLNLLYDLIHDITDVDIRDSFNLTFEKNTRKTLYNLENQYHKKTKHIDIQGDNILQKKYIQLRTGRTRTRWAMIPGLWSVGCRLTSSTSPSRKCRYTYFACTHVWWRRVLASV